MLYTMYTICVQFYDPETNSQQYLSPDSYIVKTLKVLGNNVQTIPGVDYFCVIYSIVQKDYFVLLTFQDHGFDTVSTKYS